MAIERKTLIVVCLVLAQVICSLSADIDDETGCPLNVDHVCEVCVADGNRLGCYCDDDGGVTINIFTSCKKDIEDPCIKNARLCQNGAACIREGLTNFKCNCTGRFVGDFCNASLASCKDSGVVCKNSECVETDDEDLPVYCQCYDGTKRSPFQNNTCPLSPCFDSDTNKPVCENEGKCRIVNNAAFCECAKGFGGQNCSKALKSPLCEDRPGICGEGVCQQQLRVPIYTCNCGSHPNTFAASTITDLVKCQESGCYSSNPCQNGGICSNKKDKGAFVCQCPARFTGSKCEKSSACFNNPCKNGGTCEAFNETLHFCKCPAYFTGVNCEIAVLNPCKGKNCGSFGVCEDIKGQAYCKCDDGIHLDNTPCESPCRNFSCGPGACSINKNMTNQPYCSCPVDRLGARCELPRDVCREHPRCGGGYCKPNYASPRGFSCVCEGGAIQADPCPFSSKCPIQDCGDKGICVETDGIVIGGARPIYYVCQCLNGYITSNDCNGLTDVDIPAAKNICGTAGRPYPSRNPNKPIGCWCNNGTLIEAMDRNGGENCGAIP